MRRIFILLLILLSVLLLATACARDEEPVPEQTQTSQAPPEPSYTPEPAEPPIAFVLNGQTQFNETFAQAAQPQVEAAGFRALLFYSESAEAQVEDMYAAIGSGAACIVVSPFDMDNLYEVLDEADMQGIPVVNVNVPVAGIVKTLVSPDYAEMGAMAAQACGNARPDGASVLM
ncbi:MAG TPA: hypothetical protein DEB31_04760, partial [Clostridiales bacterium]|nr:hypothetical protein [Clostridiales bacterium]